MVLLKTSLLLSSLLVISCMAVNIPTDVAAKVDVAHPSLSNGTMIVAPVENGSSTTQVPPITSTTISTTTSTTSKPITSSISPTTTIPTTTTTTPKPNTTTSTQKPITTTIPVPSPTSTTTQSPNVTTSAPPTPHPEPPTPARSWDGPSFFGGMVLAFGIVAVGFVGYRFFYLGRGSAYHTL